MNTIKRFGWGIFFIDTLQQILAYQMVIFQWAWSLDFRWTNAFHNNYMILIQLREACKAYWCNIQSIEPLMLPVGSAPGKLSNNEAFHWLVTEWRLDLYLSSPQPLLLCIVVTNKLSCFTSNCDEGIKKNLKKSGVQKYKNYFN